MFDKCIILVLDDRSIAIRRCIDLCVKRYRNMECDVIYLKTKSNITADKLSNLTVNSKLIIISHSDQYQCFSSIFGYLRPYKLHQILLKLGLKEVGLISFKGCNIGYGRFLDSLKIVIGDTIKVGYFLGYKGPSMTLFEHECIGYLEILVHSISFGRAKIPDKYRVRILSGNIKYHIPLRNKKRWRDVFNTEMTDTEFNN
ncbi:hypothetical protein ACFLJF_005384 [Salmonella enterica]